MEEPPPPNQMPAPQPQPQPQYAPAYQPPQQPVAPAPQPLKPTQVRQDLSPALPTSFLILCLVGVVVITVGAILGTSASLITDDYDEMRDIQTYSRIILLIGVALLVIGLLAAGFFAKDLSPRNRSTLYIAAVVVLVVFYAIPPFG